MAQDGGTMRDESVSELSQCTSRRQFLGSTVSALAAGLAVSMGVSLGRAHAEAFAEYTEYDGIGLAELVRRKQVKPEELLEAAILRIEKLNPGLNAVVTKMYEEARQSLDRGLPDGPFTGVPFVLKDLGTAYAGTRLTNGAELFAEYVPMYDSELVRRYKKSGLVTVGKTNTAEFGLNFSTEPALFGSAHNPWNTERSTGGSSGGSAAAVAARIVPIAHGNDGGGSIRVPGSCCGLFGMKPSRGRTPTGPEFGEIWEGLAVNHVVSLSVRDSAALLDATSSPDLGAPYRIPAPQRAFAKEVENPPDTLRIAFFSHGSDANNSHPDCVAAVKDVAALCESLGHTVTEAAPEIDYHRLWDDFYLVIAAHMAADLDRISHFTGIEITPDLVEPWTWSTAETGRQASAAEFARTKATFNSVTRTIAKFLTDYDVILTPTIGTPPPQLGYFDTVNLSREEMYERMFHAIPFTWLHNVTGTPAMSMPLYWNADRLPIGVQFAGRFAEEATLFRLAGQLEQARPWRMKIPVMAQYIR